MIDESYPNFLCPNCRGLADLEADVDEPFAEEWQEDEDEGAQQDKSSLREPGEGVVYPTVPQATRPCAPPAQPAEHDPEPSSRIERRPIPPAAAIPPATRTPITPTTTNSPITAAVEARNRINMTNGAPRTIRNRRLSSIDQLPTALGELTIQDPSLTRSSAPATQSPAPRPGPSGAAPTPPSTTTPILAPTPTLPPPSRTPRTATGTLDTPTTAIPRNADQLGPDEQALQDLAVGGPKTPRNDAGPFVLDGSAGRTGGGRGLDELVIEGMGGGGGRNGE